MTDRERFAADLRDMADEVRLNRPNVRVKAYRPFKFTEKFVEPCDRGLILIDQVIDALERAADALSTNH